MPDDTRPPDPDPRQAEPDLPGDPTRRQLLGTMAATACLAGTVHEATSAAGEIDRFLEYPESLVRVWVGPDFWANRLQDWRVRSGRLECVQAGPAWGMRTIHLLTRRLESGQGTFVFRVRTGRVSADSSTRPDAATGFLLAAGARMDYRAAALIHHVPGRGGGIFAGLLADGRLQVRSFASPDRPVLAQEPPDSVRILPAEVELELSGEVTDSGWTLNLTAIDPATRAVLATLPCAGTGGLAGNVALVSHPGSGGSFWFRSLRLSGNRISSAPERALGPILCTQYTVQDGILKLTAQLAPVGAGERHRVLLQAGPGLKTVAVAAVEAGSYVARFRLTDWPTDRDVKFRVVYQPQLAGSHGTGAEWHGVVRKDPIKQETVVVASLSCVQQVGGQVGAAAGSFPWAERVWFPHTDLVPNLAELRPDLYFFAGDQIYEGNPTRPIREPAAEAELDYLYKWYLWCWAFGPLLRDTPSVCLPDDHDVYHGNIWGMGGRAAAAGDPAGLKGGYGMPADWVNLVQVTQTSHLPDPYDPTPAEQGIGVYYTSLVVGGVGFAILEDRKFKSSPTLISARMTADSHITDPSFPAEKADVPGATLLGARQQEFLEAFALDWTGQEMKAVLSQTIFANLQISSRPPTTGELDRDLDSGGWPASGRKAALRAMRRGFMIHLAGDQHLASAIHHGVEEWDDAGWSLCSPSISNVYPRFWNPNYPPEDPQPGRPPFLGRYRDGFRNLLTVHAVANPVEVPQQGQFPDPVELHRKAPGYSAVRFNKVQRTMTLGVWPRYAPPRPDQHYPGWPITVTQLDQYGRRPTGWLPWLKIKGLRNPVVRVTDQSTDEVLYSLRLRGTEFQPFVFGSGPFSVSVGEPGTGRHRILRDLKPEQVPTRQFVEVVVK